MFGSIGVYQTEVTGLNIDKRITSILTLTGGQMITGKSYLTGFMLPTNLNDTWKLSSILTREKGRKEEKQYLIF